MRPAELDALIEQGTDALRAALGRGRHQQALSSDERQQVVRALARFEAIVEAPAEEPQESPADSEPEPKAAEAVAKSPRRSARKKG